MIHSIFCTVLHNASCSEADCRLSEILLHATVYVRVLWHRHLMMRLMPNNMVVMKALACDLHG